MLLLVLMVFAPHGLMGLALWRRRQRPPALPPAPADPLPALHPRAAAPQALLLRGLDRHFGGVAALQGCTLTAAAGQTHALVGPNGSGKTTTLNRVSGFIRADAGQLRLGETDLAALAPHQITRLGVGRTFQTPKLLAEMSVLDNVRLGGYGRERANAVEVALALPRARRDHARSSAEAMALLRFVGLAERAHDLVGALPHGQQRLVEIARALAGRPALLLLDEPAPGLSMAELDRLGALIEAITALGTTVLIVEHHLALIARVSQVVTVLDRGQVLASGTPDEVFRHPEVARAYRGREGREGSAGAP